MSLSTLAAVPKRRNERKECGELPQKGQKADKVTEKKRVEVGG